MKITITENKVNINNINSVSEVNMVIYIKKDLINYIKSYFKGLYNGYVFSTNVD